MKLEEKNQQFKKSLQEHLEDRTQKKFCTKWAYIC